MKREMKNENNRKTPKSITSWMRNGKSSHTHPKRNEREKNVVNEENSLNTSCNECIACRMPTKTISDAQFFRYTENEHAVRMVDLPAFNSHVCILWTRSHRKKEKKFILIAQTINAYVIIADLAQVYRSIQHTKCIHTHTILINGTAMR